MNRKKILLWILGVVAIIAIPVIAFMGIYVRPFMSKMMVVRTVPYDQQLTLVLGGGGNSGILVSDSLVLVVDTKMKEAADNLYQQVKQLAGNKPIIVVNTHVHTDHSNGNHLYKGQTIIAGGNYDKDFWSKDAGAESLPTQWVKDSLVFKVGDETVTVRNLGFDAHTQSDVVVYLANRKLLFTGDVVLNRQIPALFNRYRASSAGYMKAFDLMEKQFDVKTVVPGHGDIGGVEVIDNYRTFFNDMETAAHDNSKKDELTAKYKDWGQVPFLMSPGATISYMEKENSK
jgi:cyclase